MLEDGIGDTVRVSLTEDPEFEIPVCRDLVKRYSPPTPQKGDLASAQNTLSKVPDIISKNLKSGARSDGGALP